MGNSKKQDKTKKNISRLVDKQFNLHVDTENLRKNVHKLNLNDIISISEKYHGTSFVCGNILVNKKLKWYEKLLKKIGVNIENTEYDIVHSSRKVVKNEFETTNKKNYYKQDIWGIVKDEIKEIIPKGYTLYGEIVGYLPDGSAIQKNYDYWCTSDKIEFDTYGRCMCNAATICPNGKVGSAERCTKDKVKPKQHKTIIYRITYINIDGVVSELTDLQIKDFCQKYNLECKPIYYYGKILDYLDANSISILNWQENFIKSLEKKI
jgi:hypothetical protein